MKNYYHVSSKALEKNVMFRSREDFVVAMNDVAMCALRFDVRILCFCLMSNHFHFVLKGSYSECYAFIAEFKRLCSMRMHIRNGEIGGMRDVVVQLDLLDTVEYLENAIAYVLRNPLAARIIAMPYFYEWSSILTYFRGGKLANGLCLNKLSVRKRREVLKSKYDAVPDSFVLTEQGYVDTTCYIDAEEVERIFRHPSRFIIALGRKVENEFEIATGAAQRLCVTDIEIQSQMRDLIQKEFGVSSLSQLSADDRLRMCLLLKRNFNASVKQIARVLRLSQDVVASVL